MYICIYIYNIYAIYIYMHIRNAYGHSWPPAKPHPPTTQAPPQAKTKPVRRIVDCSVKTAIN